MIEITKSRFRGLLTLNIIIIVLGLLVYGFTRSHLPPPLVAYIEATRQAELTTFDIVFFGFATILFFAWVIVIIGLYRFKPFAPKWNLIVYLLMVGLFTFDEPNVESALSSTLFQLTVFLDGIIIALTFFSPAALWFQREQTTAPAPAGLIEG